LGHTVGFSSMMGLLSMLSILVLILIYLLKPKPFKKVIPSLIFLESQKKRSYFRSFFGRFVKDWLFVLQFLILISISLAVAGAFTFLDMYVRNDEVVFVLDASASSSVMRDGKTRFELGKEKALENLGNMNSIILAKDSPELLGKQVTAANARRIIRSAKGSSSGSNLWDAILMAEDVAGPGARIFVFSDFKDTFGRDPFVASDVLISKGFAVSLVNTGSEGSNTGIIGYKTSDDALTLEVKNYNAYPVQVTLSGKAMSIPAGSIEEAEFKLSPGVTEYSISEKDDLMLDNSLTIAVPESHRRRVLFITNTRGTNLQEVFAAIPGLDISVAEPPIIPKIDHDMIVIDQVDGRKIISGVMDQIRDRVNSGASLVIAGQTDIGQIDMRGLLPVAISKVEQSSVPIINSKAIDRIEDINFGQSAVFLDSELVIENSIIVAQTVGDVPVIVSSGMGDGRILYYGIIDEQNSFRFSTDYPVFWYEMTRLLSGESSLVLSNRKVGDVISGSEVVSPSGRKSAGYMKADEIGVYKAGGKSISVNLLNPLESDISEVESDEVFDEAKRKKSLEKVELLPYLLLFAGVLMLLELIVLKARGDI